MANTIIEQYEHKMKELLKENMELGDSIKINESSCKSSELMKNNNNIKASCKPSYS